MLYRFSEGYQLIVAGFVEHNKLHLGQLAQTLIKPGNLFRFT